MSWACIICRDVFENSSSVCCAPCGHIFHESCLVRWLQESQTCPQCRRAVLSSGKVRLYPDISSDSSLSIPPNNSENDVRLELREKEVEITILANRNEELAMRCRTYETEMANLRYQRTQFVNTVQQMKLRIDHLNGQANRATLLENESLSLREEIERYKSVKKIVLETQSEVTELVKRELDYCSSENFGSTVNKLATYICTLKKELDTTVKKKNSLYNELIDSKRTQERTNHRYTRCKEVCETFRQRIVQLQRGDSMIQDDPTQSALPEANNSISNTSAISVKFGDSPSAVKFSEGCKKIEVIVLDDNCTMSTSSVFTHEPMQKSSNPNIKTEALRLSEIPSARNQTDSITRNGYDGFGGHESVVRKLDVKLIRRIGTTNKGKKASLKKQN